jgi:hypothetical protein
VQIEIDLLGVQLAQKAQQIVPPSGIPLTAGCATYRCHRRLICAT